MRLQVSQCVHCVKTDNVHQRVFSAKYCVCTFPSAFIALNRIMCIKRVFWNEVTRFSAFKVVFAKKKNALKRGEMSVSVLVRLILHNSMRLHVSQCFHCVKTENVLKTRF